ncbi:MAG: M81 family metallopeptidase [Rubrivivax sp.]
MRIFAASIGTETNTFSPIPTALSSFHEGFYAPPGQHPEDAKLCTAPLWVARQRAREEGWTLIEGTCTFAEPAGLVARPAWETLREEVLGQLRGALPVDGVLLGLHGAMVADGCDDCEGELIEAVRAMVGPAVPIGVELDPHCHMTLRRVRHATLIICFKEFPHTDFVERGREVVDLTLRAVRGEIRPVMSLADCRMVGSYPTTIQPMRGFVDRISALQGHEGVLSVSVAHCFPYADVPEVGSRILVVTDDRKAHGDALALSLAQEFFGMRGRTLPPYLDPDGIIDAAAALPGTVVVADPSDNPGGGAPGDSTQLLRRLIERDVRDVALAPLWDPIAVQLCFMAGEGGRLRLRFGGKTAPASGQPIDAQVRVKALRRQAHQTFVGARVPLGDCAVIELGGIEVVLISQRTQAFGTDLLSAQGVNLADKRMVVVKSTNHFHAAFAPIASKVLYCDSGGPIPRDHRQVPYTRAQRPLWPLDEAAQPLLLALD